MKLLVICSTIDLKHNFATSQFLWQLFKGLYECGNDVIVIPYMGYPVESLWWRTYPNPCAIESLSYNYLADRFRIRSVNKKGTTSLLVDKYIKPRWQKHLINILEKEQNVDAVMWFVVPLNHLNSLPTKIKKEFHIPVIYFDGDLPTSLPQFSDTRSFKFNYYPGADLSEYDLFISNAICAVEPLKELGAKVVKILFYGVDPDVCYPLEIKKDYDVFYSGIRCAQKEKQMEYMIGEPSKQLDYKFIVGGKDDEKVDLGRAKRIGIVPMNEWQRNICRSKIALNITKEFDAKLYGTSSMRPFELASMGACVVSDPYNGLNEWFDIGKEMFIVHNAKESIELYQTLLHDDDLRIKTGQLARQRVLKEHTTKLRARQLVGYIDEVKKFYNHS
ncbi:MAG: glycosyltransferase [Lutibacter sp.]|jgi:spore maturation protein CgeB